MKNYDHFDFEELTHEEDSFKQKLSTSKMEKQKTHSPKSTTLKSILDYSKALSVRELNSLGPIEQLLN